MIPASPVLTMAPAIIAANMAMNHNNTFDEYKDDTDIIDDGVERTINSNSILEKLFLTIILGEIIFGLIAIVIGIVAGWNVGIMIGIYFLLLFGTIGCGMLVWAISMVMDNVKRNMDCSLELAFAFISGIMSTVALGGSIAIIWGFSMLYTIGIPILVLTCMMLIYMIIQIWKK